MSRNKKCKADRKYLAEVATRLRFLGLSYRQIQHALTGEKTGYTNWASALVQTAK